MITDLVAAQHSMIDPLSEAIQIVGRFRKPEGGEVKKEIIHITNYDPILSNRSREDTIKYVHEKFIVYEAIQRFLDASTEAGAVDALREMLDRSEYKRFINLDGTRNYFMQDNLIEQEQVNGFYQSSENLKEAYRLSKHFNVFEKVEKYDFTDKDRRSSNKHASLKTVYEVIIPILHEINLQDNIYLKTEQIGFLENQYPKVVQSYRILGYEKLTELGFNQIKIREAIKQKQEKSSMFGLLEYIEHNFQVGEEISSITNCNRLKRGLRQLNLHHLSPNIRLLRNYCRLSERITIGRNRRGREIKGYRILEVYNTLKD